MLKCCIGGNGFYPQKWTESNLMHPIRILFYFRPKLHMQWQDFCSAYVDNNQWKILHDNDHRYDDDDENNCGTQNVSKNLFF